MESPEGTTKKKTRKRSKKNAKNKSLKAVIYLGHIPRGFVEKGIKNFFSQFGDVKKVKLARSKRTGNPKGYAFVEFDSEEVAEVAADTMNGYLMCGRVLKCNVVSQPKRGLFGGYKHPYHRQPRRAVAVARYNKAKTPQQLLAQANHLVKRTRRKQEELEKLGINYSVPEVALPPLKSKHIVF